MIGCPHVAKTSKRVPTPFGLHLRETRDRKKIGQEKLAKLAGVSRPTIANIESGKNATVQVGTAMKLAKALEVSVDYLAGAGVDFAVEIVDRYMASQYARDDAPTPDEELWLRSRSVTLWIGSKPTDKSISLILQAYRSAKDC